MKRILIKEIENLSVKLMKPQKSALDFYLLASPITQTVRTPEIQMDRETACHPWTIKKAGSACPTTTL